MVIFWGGKGREVWREKKTLSDHWYFKSCSKLEVFQSPVTGQWSGSVQVETDHANQRVWPHSDRLLLVSPVDWMVTNFFYLSHSVYFSLSLSLESSCRERKEEKEWKWVSGWNILWDWVRSLTLVELNWVKVLLLSERNEWERKRMDCVSASCNCCWTSLSVVPPNTRIQPWLGSRIQTKKERRKKE